MPAAERPNLLLVLADRWRGQALGFLGEEKVQTPKLDGFAREAVVFTSDHGDRLGAQHGPARVDAEP